ncbi:MAG: hypothetical protein ACFFFH_02620 [Candidatus Thorarchaeota archaeon]
MIVIIGGIMLGNSFDSSNEVEFRLLNEPPSKEGTGSLIVYEALVTDTLIRESYEIYLGINWMLKNKSVVDTSGFLERYSDDEINRLDGSKIIHTQELSYKWDAARITPETYKPVIWMKLVNVQKHQISMNYLIFNNWTYKTIINHNASVYENYNWFWFGPGSNPSPLGADLAGALTLKLQFIGIIN